MRISDASVAQPVEQLIRNQQVVCSSHITSSIHLFVRFGQRGVFLPYFFVSLAVF